MAVSKKAVKDVVNITSKHAVKMRFINLSYKNTDYSGPAKTQPERKAN